MAFKKTVLLSAAVVTLALALTSRCASQSLQPCDGSEFILAENIVGEVIDNSEFILRSTSYHESDSPLSLHLDLMENSLGYAEAIPLRLTVTNETDEPIIFLRPRDISLQEGLYPIGLEIRLVSSSGETIRPEFRWTNPSFPLPFMPREAFSTLPPRERCYIDFQLAWDRTWLPLEEPIPSGDYQISVRFQGIAVGPQIDSVGQQFLDIGAWVGYTEASNVVTLTILPATEKYAMPH